MTKSYVSLGNEILQEVSDAKLWKYLDGVIFDNLCGQRNIRQSYNFQGLWLSEQD